MANFRFLGNVRFLTLSIFIIVLPGLSPRYRACYASTLKVAESTSLTCKSSLVAGQPTKEASDWFPLFLESSFPWPKLL